MQKTILSVIAVAVVIGGAAFYGGMKYARNSQASIRQSFQDLSPEERQQRFQQFGVNMGMGRMGVRGSSGPTAGEIISNDDKSVTIKLRDGGSKIIFFSGLTEITKSVSGTSGDLKAGKTITVNGTTNQDSSITAQSIQLR